MSELPSESDVLPASLDIEMNEFSIPEQNMESLRRVNITALLTSISQSSQSMNIPDMQDSYFTLFFSSKQSQQMIIPKYVCNFTAVLLLMLKLSNYSHTLSWFFVFFPLFFSNLITFTTKCTEIHYLLKVRDLPVLRAVRQFATLVDLLGSVYLKIVLLVYLTTETPASNLLFYCLPFWLCLAGSIGLRIWNQQINADVAENMSRAIPNTKLTRQQLLNWFSIGMLLLLRGAQLLLIGLKLNHNLSPSTHWSIVFVPCFFLLFFMMACSLLLVSFSPFVTSMTIGSALLKEITLLLVYLVAFQIAFGSICCMTFLILLSKRLDYEYSHHMYGQDVPTTTILYPLLILFLLLLLVNPLYIRFTTKYQEVLTSLVLQRQNRPGNMVPSNANNILSENELVVERKRKEYHFLQVSPNLYVPCDFQGNTIDDLFPKKSFKEQAKDLFHSLVPKCRFLRFNKGNPIRITRKNSRSSSYNQINQTQSSHAVSPTKSSSQTFELSTFHRNVDEKEENAIENGLPKKTFSARDSHQNEKEQQQEREEVENYDSDEEEEILLFSLDNLDTEIQRIQRVAERDVSVFSPFNTNGSGKMSPAPQQQQAQLQSASSPPPQSPVAPVQCVVCLSHSVNCIIYDCGHSVTCLACGLSLAKKQSSNHCPICRANISILFEMSTKPFPLNNRKYMINSYYGYYFHFLSSQNGISNSHNINDSVAVNSASQQPFHSSGGRTNPLIQSLQANRPRLIPNTISFFAVHNNTVSYHDSVMDIILS
jgi:hypothetical protein